MIQLELTLRQFAEFDSGAANILSDTRGHP